MKSDSGQTNLGTAFRASLNEINERHRHRYQFNREFEEMLTAAGLRITGETLRAPAEEYGGGGEVGGGILAGARKVKENRESIGFVDAGIGELGVSAAPSDLRGGDNTSERLARARKIAGHGPQNEKRTDGRLT